MMISCFHCIFVSGLCALLMQWMVDGPGLRRAQKLVAAALIAELVVSPHLHMAARIARMTQQAHATHKRVQVRIVWVNALGCLRCSSCIGFYVGFLLDAQLSVDVHWSFNKCSLDFV